MLDNGSNGERRGQLPILPDVTVPDLKKVRQQYHDHMPQTRTPSTLGVRAVMPSPLRINSNAMFPRRNKDETTDARRIVERIDIDKSEMGNDWKRSDGKRKQHLNEESDLSALSLSDMLQEESFVSELLEGFSPGSLSGFQVLPQS